MSTRDLPSRADKVQCAGLVRWQAQFPAHVRPAAGAQRSEHRQRGASNGSSTKPFSLILRLLSRDAPEGGGGGR